MNRLYGISEVIVTMASAAAVDGRNALVILEKGKCKGVSTSSDFTGVRQRKVGHTGKFSCLDRLHTLLSNIFYENF